MTDNDPSGTPRIASPANPSTRPPTTPPALTGGRHDMRIDADYNYYATDHGRYPFHVQCSCGAQSENVETWDEAEDLADNDYERWHRTWTQGQGGS
jgi:hypothetical protein